MEQCTIIGSEESNRHRTYQEYRDDNNVVVKCASETQRVKHEADESSHTEREWQKSVSRAAHTPLSVARSAGSGGALQERESRAISGARFGTRVGGVQVVGTLVHTDTNKQRVDKLDLGSGLGC